MSWNNSSPQVPARLAEDDPSACIVTSVPEGFDVEAMVSRFRERAAAVRRRGLPPVEGAERKRIIDQMQLDFQDFAMLGDATGTLTDGILTLQIDLRPQPDAESPA